MTTSDAPEKKEKRPLWLAIEEQILKLGSQDLAAQNYELSVQRVAAELDNAGYKFSCHGGRMLDLRFAMKKACEVGRPLMKDFNSAVAALTLEDAAEPYPATTGLIDKIGQTWPDMKKPERRADVIAIVEKARIDLLVAKAKGLPGDEGIRLLIEEKLDFPMIIAALGISQEELDQVNEQIKKERAERARVAGLLEKVAGKSDEERVRFLIDNDVSEALIREMAGVDQGVVDAVNKAMEEELKEKQRLAEEEAARKKAEAEGPALEDIPADQMLEYIESVREIMEFSDQEKEIRVMCEQSSIPKALVDIAVTDTDKLDELEKQAEGS